MLKKVISNILIVAISLFFSIIIWLYVNNEEDPLTSKTFRNIPVSILNEDAFTNLGYTYIIKDGETVTVTVTGRNSIISRISDKDINATADFKQLSKVNAVPITVSTMYDSSVDLSLVGTGMMTIESEHLSEAQLPVTIQTKGKPEENYIYRDNGKVTPNMITVRAPKSIVERAKELKITVNISGATDAVEVVRNPVLYDNEGKKIISNQITLDTNEVQAKLPILKMKVVPVFLKTEGNVKKGYHLQSFAYSPKEIKVAGKEEIINQLNSIDLGEVSIEKKDKTYENNFQVKNSMLPDGIYLAEEPLELKLQCKIEKDKNTGQTTETNE